MMTTARKTLCVTGSILLLAMGAFHGSGLFWFTDIVAASNIEPFLINVLPVLFIHVSLQLIGLAMMGFACLTLRNGVRAIAFFIAAMVLADVGLALWLDAYPPAVALALACLCFLGVALKAEQQPREAQ